MEVHLRTDGEALEAVWHRPFTHNGFPITSYTLTITNKTTGLLAGKASVETGLDDDVQMYELRKPAAVMFAACHELVYALIASNTVGDSMTGDVVISGFPICEYVCACV